MKTHLKTEIIYYNCTTDFEFEFNLNSVHPMRLLSESSQNQKEMLSFLARAVSRSRIIFISSPFNDNLIDTISQSIGFKSEAIPAEEYGITKKTTDKLITGGVPLVTEDGIYAGIILESGPQSLILITDERDTRKKIMRSLVNQYITDLCNCEISDYDEETAESIKEPTTQVNVSEIPTDDIIREDTTKEEIVSEQQSDITENEPAVDDEPIISVEEPITTQKLNPLTTLTVILTIILFLLLAFIIYSLIISPILNGVSIIENIKRIFWFLF